MYAVIFTATMKLADDEYFETAARMRELALSRYGCREFTALSEGNQEIAISYWDSESDISAWKSDPAHQQAQRLGREQWYASYRVQVARVERQYQQGGESL
ncbi:antibiotic biosynthesis monooxygenase family protein [Aestuariirhabdus sp. LZHN29]|uniref:antibiotic biosynthesis monooxygenase family protein n=1 Tax=Aestuariirhabdus sp. LZHN29 TaxID=3417462 RepID=UPI003CF9EF58